MLCDAAVGRDAEGNRATVGASVQIEIVLRIQNQGQIRSNR